jgi:SAM-dependent methyltransferase
MVTRCENPVLPVTTSSQAHSNPVTLRPTEKTARLRLTRHHSDTIDRSLEIYRRQHREFLRQWGTPSYKRPQLLKDLQHELPGQARILDLGCGGGQDSRALWKGSTWVTGLDAAFPLLAFARRRSPTVPLLVGDFRHLPFKPRRFDAVWAAASLIHCQKSQMPALLRRLRNMVTPHGLLATTVPYGQRSGVLEDGWLPGRFIARWQKAEFLTVLELAGWTTVSLKVVTHRERRGRWLAILARKA